MALNEYTIRWERAVGVELLPVRLFVVATKVGGQVFGAFDKSRMIGFLLAIPGIKSRGESYLHSHMMGVLPEYRNKGVGRMLKLRQRDDAVARGVRIIEWTFDPLELKNAFFNIERLGAVIRRYVLNQYGTTSSHLHGGLPTDRCVAEWHVSTDRVREMLSGERPEEDILERIEVPHDRALHTGPHASVLPCPKVVVYRAPGGKLFGDQYAVNRRWHSVQRGYGVRGRPPSRAAGKTGARSTQAASISFVERLVWQFPVSRNWLHGGSIYLFKHPLNLASESRRFLCNIGPENTHGIFNCSRQWGKSTLTALKAKPAMIRRSWAFVVVQRTAGFQFPGLESGVEATAP